MQGPLTWLGCPSFASGCHAFVRHDGPSTRTSVRQAPSSSDATTRHDEPWDREAVGWPEARGGPLSGRPRLGRACRSRGSRVHVAVLARNTPSHRVSGRRHPAVQEVSDVLAVGDRVSEPEHVPGAGKDMLDGVSDAAAQDCGGFVADEGVVLGGEDQRGDVDVCQLAAVVRGEGRLRA